MTTIYTKPQIDAMAVKIGGEIKAAKTTVTQSQGQSTTYAVSQKMITDSLSAFGTAAYKNVGTAAGQIPLSQDIFKANYSKTAITAHTAAYNCNNFELGTLYSVNASSTLNAPTAEGILYWSVKTVVVEANTNPLQIARGLTGNAIQFRQKVSGAYLAWSTILTSANTTKDANGFLRDSSSIAETVVADATGNVAVASIQAGVGAPKIAYKKFVLPSGTPTVAHGLNRDKILDISGVYVSGVERYPYTQAKVNATILDAEPSSTFERHILITYEV